jgi:hypothetical protein
MSGNQGPIPNGGQGANFQPERAPPQTYLCAGERPSLPLLVQPSLVTFPDELPAGARGALAHRLTCRHFPPPLFCLAASFRLAPSPFFLPLSSNQTVRLRTRSRWESLSGAGNAVTVSCTSRERSEVCLPHFPSSLSAGALPFRVPRTSASADISSQSLFLLISGKPLLHGSASVLYQNPLLTCSRLVCLADCPRFNSRPDSLLDASLSAIAARVIAMVCIRLIERLAGERTAGKGCTCTRFSTGCNVSFRHQRSEEPA